MEVPDELFNSQNLADEHNPEDSSFMDDQPSTPTRPSSSSQSQSRTGSPSYRAESPPIQYDVGSPPRLEGDVASAQIDSSSDEGTQRNGQRPRRRQMVESDSEDDNDGLEDEDDGLEEPKRKLKDPSPVWECGAVKMKDGAKCTICGKTFKTGASCNTSNITKHIRSRHNKTWEARKLEALIKKKKEEKEKKDKEKEEKNKKKKQLKQTSVISFMKRTAVIDPAKKKKIDRAILKHIVVEKEPFDLVEKHSFRDMLFACKPSYTCPSHQTVRRHFDSFAKEVGSNLKKEIAEDLDVPDKVINITSDHGTSHDKFRSRKNVLTLSRCTKDFVIKTDTLAVINCQGTQSGDVIRKDVKCKLDEVGRDNSWVINWVTDGEKKQINARAPGKHPHVGLETHYTANCVDHTLHLVVEQSLEDCIAVQEAVGKAHKLVNCMKESTLMRDAFLNQIIASGEDPLSVIKGTPNRWYFKYLECNRVLLLRTHVEKFQEEYEHYPVDAIMEPEDWRNLKIYVNSLKTLVDASDIFEGENYPTASSVIPFLDQVFTDLARLEDRLPASDKAFPRKVLANLKSDRRFPNGYKDTTPFNCLTLLDPNYMDIYLNHEEADKAFDAICQDIIFAGDVPEIDEPSNSSPQISVPLAGNSFTLRRAQLLASKQAPEVVRDSRPTSLKQKLSEERDKFLSLRGCVDLFTNPQIWWKEHAKEYPLLARFYRAYCCFPATSTASERVFNIEGLIVTKYRKNLEPTRAGNLVVCKDYLKRRQNEDLFRLCKECYRLNPTTPTYVVNCSSHNT